MTKFAEFTFHAPPRMSRTSRWHCVSYVQVCGGSYLYIRQTGGSARGIGAGYYVVLSRILQMDFREFYFYALR
jgi:hypothetical protein